MQYAIPIQSHLLGQLLEKLGLTADEIKPLVERLRGAEGSQQSEPKFPNIATETRPLVDTAIAAYWLGRKEQTLRGWACNEDGPLRPTRIHGRLYWSTQKIRELLGVA